MAKARDPEAGRFQPMRGHLRIVETDATRLAHWPPPYRAGVNKPVLMKQPPSETPKRARPRGWRLTRAMFSEFSED